MVVITNCENTDDWAAFNGAISLDVVDFKQGSASIKATGDATDHDFVYAIYNPAGTWDLSAEDHLTFWFQAQELTDLRVKIYSGANEGLDFIEWARQFKQQILVVDTWYRVKLYYDDFDTSNGAIDMSAVKAIRLRMYQTGTNAQFHVDEILSDEYDPIKAKIGATTGLEYVSDDVLEADIWGEDLQVGRWQLLLKNIDNKYGGRFHAAEDSVIEINTVSMMKGYVDDVFPFLGDRGYYTNKLTVVGRDYGRDLARLMYSAGYVDTRGDDIIEAILIAKGSEISFNSPSTAAIIPIERTRTYLIDWLHDVGAELNHSGYVNQAKALKFFPVGTVPVPGGMALKSIQGAVDNNILHLLKGEEIGFSIVNVVELSAGSLIDHYSDGNKDDYTLGAGTAIANETTIKVVGLSSIKFSNAGAAKPKITLDFSGAGLYSHAGLDMSLSDQLSFYIRHDNVAEEVIILFTLEDNAGNIIEFFRGKEGGSTSAMGKTRDLPINTWHKIQISYGDNIDLANGAFEPKNNRWYNTVGAAFSWDNVVKISWQAVQLLGGAQVNLSATDLYLDAFTVPTIEVISLISDAVSDAAYGTSEWFDQRNDIKTQIELDIAAASELEKRKDVLKNIMVIAKGQTGIKYAGQTVTVQAPKHGLAGATTYRIVSYHHQYRKEPIYKGHSFITTLELIRDDLSPATQFIDPTRYRLNRDPVGAALEALALTRRRTRSAESTQRKQYGVTRPSVKVLFSGSGVAFPEDPVDGFVFKLTGTIAGYYAATYEYDGDIPDWTRGPIIIRRTDQPPGGTEVHGDFWVDTDAGTNGITYQWDSVLADWIQIGSAAIVDAPDFGSVEWPTDQLAIEMRPWTGNFSLIWDDRDDDPPTDWNHFKWGLKDQENVADATIQYAGTPPTTMDINFGQDINVADGEWFVYWDEAQLTGGDYDVQWSQNYSDASGAGKGLLAVVQVRNAASESPSVMLWNTYIPQMGVGSLVAHSIYSKHVSSDWFTGKNYRTANLVGEGGGPAGLRFDASGIYGYSGGTTKTFGILSASGYAEVYGPGQFRVLKSAGGVVVGYLDGTVYDLGLGAGNQDAFLVKAPATELLVMEGGVRWMAIDGANDRIVLDDNLDSVIPNVTGTVDLGTLALKFGAIFGTVKYTDLNLLDTHCPRCGERFEEDEDVRFVIVATETLKDSEGSSYEQIRCVPVHSQCSWVKRLRRWLEYRLSGYKA